MCICWYNSGGLGFPYIYNFKHRTCPRLPGPEAGSPVGIGSGSPKPSWRWSWCSLVGGWVWVGKCIYYIYIYSYDFFWHNSSITQPVRSKSFQRLKRASRLTNNWFLSRTSHMFQPLDVAEVNPHFPTDRRPSWRPGLSIGGFGTGGGAGHRWIRHSSRLYGEIFSYVNTNYINFRAWSWHATACFTANDVEKHVKHSWHSFTLEIFFVIWPSYTK